MKKPLVISLIVAAIIGMGQFAQPAIAVESNIQPRDAVPTNESREIESTFAVKEDEANDLASIKFGQNLLTAGNNVIERSTIKGLAFSFGNQMNVETQSEYGFIAGNNIEFSGKTKQDLFIAGNSITLAESAEIGRDTFAAGNLITVNADLPGDFSAGAAKVVFNNVKIDGNINLDVAEVAFTGQVSITGKLILNNDAAVSGLGNAKYAELEKYENVDYEVTATDIFFSKIFSILGLFITMAIVLTLFAGASEKVDRELTALQFGKDLVIGFCALVFIPILALFLIISIFAAPAGIVLLVAYLVMLYLALGFAGLWLGKLIIKKLLKTKGNRFLEVLLGIVLLVCAGMIPGFGWTITFTAIVLGMGLILQSINPSRKQNPQILTQNSRPETAVEEAEVVKTEPKSKSTPKSTTTSSDKSTKSDDTKKED